jgi:uncharacterized membrane protein YkoI
MNDKLKRGLLAGGVVAALAGGGAAIAGASRGENPAEPPASRAADDSAAESGGADDQTGRDDGAGQPVTGSEFQRASAVALDAAGGGKVTGSEKYDEEGYYEIEVTRADGSQVDVHLDRNLSVLDVSAD